MKTRLEDLAGRLSRAATGQADCPRLWIGHSDRGLQVDFFGDPADQPFQELCEAVSDPAVAPRVTSLDLRGPDEGANGTCHWDLERLAAAATGYPLLKTFTIEQGRPGDHNTHIVGGGYEENGVLGRLLETMSSLEVFRSPSAPDQTFFTTAPRPLMFVSVNAGYDHQQFVRNLAGAPNLPRLRTLEYGEGTGPGFEELERTSFEAHAGLLRSTSVRLARLVLRSPALSDAEVLELKRCRPDVQLMIVRSEASYVR